MANEKKTAMKEMEVAPRKCKSPSPAPGAENCFTSPPVDIYDNGDGLMVLVDLPGVDMENVDISVEDSRLTIKGRTSSTPTPTGSLHREFRLVNFFRQFKLGSEVDQEKISAGVKDGVLTLNLPRAEKVKPRRIEVKVA